MNSMGRLVATPTGRHCLLLIGGNSIRSAKRRDLRTACGADISYCLYKRIYTKNGRKTAFKYQIIHWVENLILLWGPRNCPPFLFQ